MLESINFRLPHEFLLSMRPRISGPQLPFKKSISTNVNKDRLTDKYTHEAISYSVEMTELGIPSFLQYSYLNGIPEPKISSLRDWQKELISLSEWKNGSSGIVLVPTSGGKTVAADIAIAQLLESNPRGKAIYALPFVSLAAEKTEEFKKRFFAHTVNSFYHDIGNSDFRRGSIAVCTFEKAHSLIAYAIRDNYISDIKLVIIDEIHMINEEERGAVVESMILKCLLLRERFDIRLLGLTATLNNDDAIKIAGWMGGFTFLGKCKSSRIKHYFKNPAGKLYYLENGKGIEITQLKQIPEDKHHILAMIKQQLIKNNTSIILVFVNSRKQTIQLAEFIAFHMNEITRDIPGKDMYNDYVISKREQIIQKLSKTDTGLDDILAKCVRAGVGFHHAGMLLKEREHIEEGAKASILSVIVATTTLSAGINIRSVRRVIIYDAYRYTSDSYYKLIPSSLYIQMAGRAGRTESQNGDVIIVGKNRKSCELNDAINLSSNLIENITPHLLEKGFFDRFFLQSISSNLLNLNFSSAQLFIEKSLMYYMDSSYDFQSRICDLYSGLYEYGLIDQEYNFTEIGRAIADSFMSIDDGIELCSDVKKYESFSKYQDLSLLFLCIPPSVLKNESTPDYNNSIWEQIIIKNEKEFEFATNINFNSFQIHIVKTKSKGGRYKDKELSITDRHLDRMYFACILLELKSNHPIRYVEKKYNISRGIIQSLQTNTSNFISQTITLCEKIGCSYLASLLSNFKKGFYYGIHNDALPLLRLPSCSKTIALFLMKNNIRSPNDIANTRLEHLSNILSQFDPNDNRIASKLHQEAIQMSINLEFLALVDENITQN